MSEKPAYTVHAAGTANCACGAGETWDIVLHQGTPEELAMSSSYDEREHAEDLASELNDAYTRGKATAESLVRELAQALQLLEPLTRRVVDCAANGITIKEIVDVHLSRIPKESRDAG